MANEIEYVIRARNEASKVLQDVRRDLVLLDEFGNVASRLEPKVEGASQAMVRFDASATRVVRSARALVVPFASELSPALSTVSQQLVGVVQSAALLGSGLGALAIGAAGVAGILGGQLIQSLNQARQVTEEFNRAQKSLDFQSVTEGLRKEREEVSKLTDELDELRDTLASLRAGQGVVPGEFGIGQGGPTSDAEERRLADAIARLEARARRAQAFRTGREVSAAAEAEYGIPQGSTEGTDAAAQAARRRTEDIRRQVLEQNILDPIERAFKAQMREADNALLQGTGPEAVAVAEQMRALARANRRNAIEARRLGFLKSDLPDYDESLAYGLGGSATLIEYGQERSFEALRVAFQGREAAPEPGIAETERFEAVGAGAQPTNTARRLVGESDVREAERARQISLQQLDIERQRAEILGTMTPEMNAQLILQERQVLLSQQGLSDDEKAIINARAELAILEQMVRLDPMAGLSAGFAEAAAASREWGSELLQVARETNQTMSRTFSDGLFNLFTGRKGQDLGKQFGESLLRSLTDVIGRQLSGTISGFFAQGLQGVRGFVPGGAAAVGGGGGFDLLSLFGGGRAAAPATLSPTGLPVGQLVMTEAGIGQVTPSGAVQILQTGSTSGGFDIGGDTAISGLKGLYGAYGGLTNFATNYAVGGISGALFGVPTVVAGGTTIAVPVGTGGYALAELGAVGVDATLGAGTAGFAGTGGAAAGVGAGLSLTGAATGVLAAVALGFTIYGGLSQERTAENIAINAISGAVSGAVIGAIIGSIFPGVGTVIGGVIGAIVGGAAAGGTTGLKAPRGMTTGERSAEIGRLGSENLSRAIASASSIEDLVTIFNTRWAPNGEVQILTTYQGVRYWAGDQDDPPGAAATPELMVIPEFLDALDIRVGETGAPQTRVDLVNAFRAKRDEILEILSNVPFGISERDGAAGVSRRTYLPFQKIYSLKRGEVSVFGSRQLYRDDLGADDNTIEFLFNRLREVSGDRALGDLTRQDFLSA